MSGLACTLFSKAMVNLVYMDLAFFHFFFLMDLQTVSYILTKSETFICKINSVPVCALRSKEPTEIPCLDFSKSDLNYV